MPDRLADLLHQWHDFYLVLGAASAALVGLMFVAASIGSAIWNEQHAAPMQAFITPTVVHFSAVLFACLLGTVPDHSWLTFGVLLGAGGVAGSLYGAKIVADLVIRRGFKLDAGDRMFYALAPLAGYLLAVVAAGLIMWHQAAGVDAMAAALAILLFAGIRNAWDMMLWIVIHTPSVPEAVLETKSASSPMAVPETKSASNPAVVPPVKPAPHKHRRRR